MLMGWNVIIGSDEVRSSRNNELRILDLVLVLHELFGQKVDSEYQCEAIEHSKVMHNSSMCGSHAANTFVCFPHHTAQLETVGMCLTHLAYVYDNEILLIRKQQKSFLGVRLGHLNSNAQ